MLLIHKIEKKNASRLYLPYIAGSVDWYAILFSMYFVLSFYIVTVVFTSYTYLADAFQTSTIMTKDNAMQCLNLVTPFTLSVAKFFIRIKKFFYLLFNLSSRRFSSLTLEFSRAFQCARGI